ncbi:hypothetical protein JCM17844_25320 [Iodidimonas gelatinilytica]|uniref:Uncharacterized protein n=1 Tax=Iodidimonas gelatinilytica TaxID=1236966 RepID=A0A5A7MVH3_9PROT|nr:hypothetical protein [Iodidimonas gelatinilytica]GEQ98895.1 hypothetical protein JCM17844_25320 [Iodidimonas gelatinilytica]GER01691.1 hypothetical protein JCM17845_23140 [Iodidimonas gelatinilytica]
MNKQRYESLPKEVQDIINAESGEALSLAFTRAMMKEADQAVARMEASPDHHFYEPSAQEAQRFYDAFARMAVDWGGEDAKRLALIEDLRAILRISPVKRRPHNVDEVGKTGLSHGQGLGGGGACPAAGPRGFHHH